MKCTNRHCALFLAVLAETFESTHLECLLRKNSKCVPLCIRLSTFACWHASLVAKDWTICNVLVLSSGVWDSYADIASVDTVYVANEETCRAKFRYQSYSSVRSFLPYSTILVSIISLPFTVSCRSLQASVGLCFAYQDERCRPVKRTSPVPLGDGALDDRKAAFKYRVSLV